MKTRDWYRHRGFGFLICHIAIRVGLAFIPTMLPRPRDETLEWWIRGAGLTALFLSAIYWICRMNRTRIVVKEARGLLCTRCEYDLAKLGDEGQCPECGALFTAPELRQYWKERNHL